MQETAGSTNRDLFEGLSDAQREAVAHTHGPLLILAGPGSGKTRVVTRRAAHLARTVTTSRHVLAITFTNKAAREMRERIQPLGVAEGMTVCTFHALCARLLREYHLRAGVPRSFTIFDREDRRKLIKQVIEELGYSTDNWTPGSIEYDISRAKNNLITAAAFAEAELDWRAGTVARVYTRYEELLKEMGGLDFDDLLMRVAMMLNDDGPLCDELEDRFRYVLIDEYQDTNAAQYQIARLLTRRNRNLCATGDPDQSIYGWRGANLGNILNFEQHYPDAKVVRLEQNYRSTGLILSAADALIVANLNRKDKKLWTDKEDGPAVRVFEFETARDEAEMIAEDIGRRIQGGTNPGGIAVFYRVNSLSRSVEEALLKRGIAYQVARGVEFYNRREVKDVLAYLRVLVNPADEVSLLRIINTPPRGLGATTLKRLIEHAGKTDRSPHDLLTGGDDLSFLGRSAAKAREFGMLLNNLRGELARPAPEALRFVISHSGLRAYYGGSGDMDNEPARNIEELTNAASEYYAEHPGATVLDWLEYTALVSDVDTVREESGAVMLMTLHAAKGLEFSVVYVIGLEEGMLPFRRNEEAVVDTEEERRLLFVGMTRAKRYLTLSRARYRMLRGSSRRTTRSPFLDELPRHAVEWTVVGSDSRRFRPAADLRPSPEDLAQWEAGTLVRHPEHGIGRILSIWRGGGCTRARVQFKNGPSSTWVLEIAGMKRVDFDDIGDLEEYPGD